jgi:hypothetical protein
MKTTATLLLSLALLSAVILTVEGAAMAGTGCTDSDGGRVYNVKGTTNGANGMNTDKCASPTRLKEYYCEGTQAKMANVACMAGCAAGACRTNEIKEEAGSTTATTTHETTTTVAGATATTLPAVTTTQMATTTTTLQQTVVSGLCSDTDGGKVYTLRGETHGINGVFADMCFRSNKMKEYYCEDDVARMMLAVCVHGCNNGACKVLASETTAASTTSTTMTTTTTMAQSSTTTTIAKRTVVDSSAAGCIDSDGGKVYDQKGTANGANGHYTDNCMSPSRLREYYCDLNLVKNEVHLCDKGCAGNRCN